MIQTPKGQVLLKTVDELIDPVTGAWDEELIQLIFNPLDVDRILRIPLNENMTDDFIAWHMTKSYAFSVRSAYFLAWNHIHNRRRQDAIGPSRINPVWEILWKLKVPSKIIFFWVESTTWNYSRDGYTL
jgi:hypothetical protein